MDQQLAKFEFGKNWERFIRDNFSDERVSIAQRHLLDFLGLESLKGRTFLDIGSGSGLHSLAAFKAGAKKIISFDYDMDSVATTKKIHAMNGSPPSWKVMQGSILDRSFTGRLEPADIVYAWGVLHHTGSLWAAMENAAALIKPGGLLYLAVYEKNEKTKFWIRVKKVYNRLPVPMKRLMEAAYVCWGCFRVPTIGRIRASLQHIHTYQKSRGMEFWTDVRDWLGGWPYEPATEQEVCSFCNGKLGLKTVKVLTGEANIEYLFSRHAGGA